jgi:hypothetical protein
MKAIALRPSGDTMTPDDAFRLKDVVDMIGPTVGLLFAAWIFLSYLQQRYTSAFDRYRTLIQDYRQHPGQDRRHESLREQVRLYKGRCEKMRLATNTGIASAMLLISGVIGTAVSVIVPGIRPLEVASVAAILVGMGLVVVASGIVLVENTQLQHAIESEISDLPELVDDAGAPSAHVRHRQRSAV